MLIIMIFLIICPQEISAAQSLSDPFPILHPIFAYCKESEILRCAEQKFALPLAHSCRLPLL